MNRKLDRCAVRKVLAASISAMGLAAFAPVVVAQNEGLSEEVRNLIEPSSTLTIGVGSASSKTAPNTGVGNWSSSTNYMFGDYNGMYKTGGYLIGDVEINKRGENNANYFELKGTNLGLDSRNLQIRGGEQGNWGLKLEYDQIHKLWSDSYQTPYLGAGSTNLTLPAGWVATNTTAGMTTLNASMQSFNIETQRKSIALGLTKLLPDDWNVAVNYKHETKQGNRLIGAVFGTSGGNPRAAVLPEPVDYITRQFDVIARYTTDKLQVQLAYFGSLFDNKKTGLVFQNAYANAAGTTWGNAAVGYAGGGIGQLGLPPDNQAHQLNGSFGYMFSKETRLAGTLSIGRMTQNESFLPYTVNAGLVSTDPLPRSSLNGKVNTTHLDFKLTSKLDPKLNLVAAYRYDDRANKTPQSLYNYIGGDAANQTNIGSTNANSDRLRINLPGSSRKQQIDVELDYKLAAHTKLKLGAEYDWVKKTFEAITSEKEATVKGEVHHHFSESTSGGLNYAYSNRKTDSYDASAPFKATFTPLYVTGMGAASLQWDNNPFQRKFFLAPRLRNKLHAFLNFEPAPKLDVHLALDYKDDNYKDSYYGLKRTKTFAQHFDASYAASDALTVRAFVSNDRTYNYEKSNTLATLANSGGLCNAKNTPTAPGCEWAADILDHGLTTGFGFAYKPAAKYEFGFDYTRVFWTGENNMSAGAGLTQPTTLPANVSNMHRIDLFGRYQLEKDLSINVKYIYERMRVADWAMDGVVSNTLANVIGTNQTSPNYNVHALGVSLSYQFK
ncbi:MAG: MtrB/PioB family decaheme-associated outer membrane protein [Sulfuritalea sp.]|nr:MtrB/PioB family decaheme-associated outer membrane protein [Sulfuritalea sp.]